MARARSRVVTTRSTRSPTIWAGVVAPSLTVFPTLTKILLALFTPSFLSGETIRRLRGTLLVESVLTTTAYHGAIGAYIASDAAVAIGVTALLDPVTNASDDVWLWYHSFAGDGRGDGSAGGNGAMLIEVESKAMRRMEEGQSLVIVGANANALSEFAVALSLRVLGSQTR